MAKHRIGTEWKQPPRISYLPRSPVDVPEMVILDESETLLGEQYSGVLLNNTEKYLSPSATIVEMGGVAAGPASLSAPIRKKLTQSPLAVPKLSTNEIAASPALSSIPGGEWFSHGLGVDVAPEENFVKVLKTLSRDLFLRVSSSLV
ncbi:unnamed protein product [Hermetia illucens]|uniref:Uncharacterized protein n=1 Tax=Hermetia illucens TaxID=343691 RepID=A0A7R8UI04_HERIL|nr:unnamed protein product [Hermetia illucens]